MSTPVLQDPTDVTWDLEPLVDGEGEAGVDRLLAEAAQEADAFAERYPGQVAALDAAGMAEAMHALVAIQEKVSRAGNYAMLRFSTDTADPARGALMARVQEQATQLETKLLFFELEWAALDEDQAEAKLTGEGLDFARHYMRSARRYKPHLLTEPEEKIYAEKSLTGASAWGRLFAEVTSAIRVDLPDQADPVALEVALSRLQEADREVRRSAAEAVTAALEPGLRTRAFIFNTLLQDKAVDDRLRNYPNWLRARNLSNEASDESVAALVEAVRGRYALPQRWYRLKAQILGVDKLADYDRAAPVVQGDEKFAWPDATELVLDAYGSFSPRLEAEARAFFDENRIDAPVRPNKRGGAFCAYTVPSVHPYVMLNWTSRRRDVLTLAHELGHGVHAALARPQGLLHQHTPLTLAETASVFGETVTFGRLLESAATPASRLSLLAESLEGAIATVFRQIAMYQFENVVHTARREEGELSTDRLAEAWSQAQSEMFGDAVQMTQGYRTWWSYIPHFINTPGYVYAYAYGQLLALSVYQRYRDEGPSFVPDYERMLAAGGSRSPEDLGQMVGIDLTDPDFWDRGLDLVEERLQDAEAAAKEAGVT
jgi:oligoendopeptidase F